MLETIKATRLFRLEGGTGAPSINTFFGLNRDQVFQLAERSEWKIGPARADEGRMYQQYIEQMRSDAGLADETEEVDEPNEDDLDEPDEPEGERNQ